MCEHTRDFCERKNTQPANGGEILMFFTINMEIKMELKNMYKVNALKNVLNNKLKFKLYI